MVSLENSLIKESAIIYYKKMTLLVVRESLKKDIDVYCQVLESDSETFYVGYTGYWSKDCVYYSPPPEGFIQP